MMRLGLGRALMFSRRFDEAVVEARAILEMEPSFRAARDGLGWLYLEMGDVDQAVAEFETLPRQTGNPYTAAGPRGVAYARAGREADAREMLALIERRAVEQPDVMVQMDRGLVHLALGEHERALDHLEAAAEARVGSLVFVPAYPAWDPVRDHPRYVALMESIGLG